MCAENLPSELLFRIISSTKPYYKIQLFGRLSQVCYTYYKKLRSYYEILLKDTYTYIHTDYCLPDPDDYVLDKVYDATPQTITISGIDTEALVFPLKDGYKYAICYSNAVGFTHAKIAEYKYKCEYYTCLRTIMAIEQRNFSQYKKHGPCFRWNLLYDTLDFTGHIQIGHMVCSIYLYGKCFTRRTYQIYADSKSSMHLLFYYYDNYLHAWRKLK